MQGFDPEFTGIEHYITVITERIWEGRGIDLILYYATSGTETTYTVHGPVTANSVTGTLALTADLSDEITDAPQIMLYGENGPANRTFGGEAEALRRIVRECAPPRMAPRRPKIEEGHKRSDW